MKPKRKSVIHCILALLAVFSMLSCGPVVADILKGGAAGKLIEQKLQSDSQFNTAGSTPSRIATSQSKPPKADTYSSASVWNGYESDAYVWNDAWHRCVDEFMDRVAKDQGALEKDHDPYGLNCILAIMKKSGASEDAIGFTRKISLPNEVPGYLETFENKGRVDLGNVNFPGRANTNEAYVLLNGSPSLVSTELDWHALDISRDPNYSRLKSQYPELQVWPAGARFISSETRIDGGQRFIFAYFLVNQCHACGVGWLAQVAFDFSRNGTFKGTKVLKLVPEENIAVTTTTKPSPASPIPHVAFIEVAVNLENVRPPLIGWNAAVAGHAWIVEVIDLKQQDKRQSYGTYPPPFSGLQKNKDLNLTPYATRSMFVTQEQLNRLRKVINDYEQKGKDAWSEWNNCTDFAQKAWEAVSGEIINRQRMSLVPNTFPFYDSIVEMNHGEIYRTINECNSDQCSSSCPRGMATLCRP